MVIPYQKVPVVLLGINSEPPDDIIIQLSSVSVTDNSSEAHVILEIQVLLDRFQHLFATQLALPPARPCDHNIPLVPSAQPVQVRPYRYPPLLKDEIERQVSDMLKLGIIMPSASPFSSLVLLVKKKDETFQFCVDYRYLNALTLKTKFLIHVFDQLMDELAGSSWFTTLDLFSGYHQIRLQPGEEYKTTFQTHHGSFEFVVMAFGLSGAPNTFQSAMNTTLAPLLRKCVIVFFDDILVYNKSFADHLSHLEQVFCLLHHDTWLIKLSKCKFAQRSITYLGHLISADGVATDLSKVEVILHWPQPSNIKDLRSFLG